MDVYIILTDTGTVFTKMIRMFTRKRLNHASLSFDKELEMTCSFGRKRMNNPFIGGFVKENMRDHFFGEANCAIYRCSVTEENYQKMLSYVREIEARQSSYTYNFLGLFGVLLAKEIKRPHAFFCSEFVATVLQRGGISVSGKLPCFVKPDDLAACKKAVFLYEGRVEEYFSHHLSSAKSYSLKDVLEQVG